MQWYNRTFAAIRDDWITIETAEDIFTKLIEIRMIKKYKDETKGYYLTALGFISKWMYYSPLDVFGWYVNFSRLYKDKLLHDDVAISWALANINDINSDFASKNELDECDHVQSRLFQLNLSHSEPVLKHIAAIYYLIIDQKTDFLEHVKRQWQSDAERIIQCIKLIDNMYTRFGLKEFFKILELRLVYGTNAAEAQLCQVKGIGKKFASKLVKEGIETVEDIITNRDLVRKAVKGFADNIITQAKSFLEVKNE